MKTQTELQQLSDAFRVARDIPYMLSTPEYDCSCSSKAKILGEILMRLGLEIKIMVCNFEWNSLPMPTSLASLAIKEFGLGKHYFLHVKGKPTKNKWITVDPTWDIKLGLIFPIAKWNGRSDTLLAVPGFNVHEYVINNQQVSLNNFYFRNRSQSKFSYQFNSWLNTMRENYERNT